MKIVLIDKEEGHTIGGITIYTQRFYKYLKSHNHKVYILRYSRKPAREKHIFTIPYYLAEPRSYIFLPTEKSLELIKTCLRKIKPDIVYTSCGLSPLDFLLPSLCHSLQIPICGVWHGDFNFSPGTYQLLIKSIFLSYLPFTRQLDLVHVFSDKLKKFHIGKGIKSERILVLPNGIDEKFYSPGKSLFDKKHKIRKGILFLARLTTQKNPRVLLEAFLSLNPPPETKLVMVGHGEQAAQLRQEFKDKRIIFTGTVKDENEKLDILRSCQIFVLPSRFEGMPLALLEAMSCGMACICSDAGANQELLSDTGIVIEANKLNQQLPLALKILLKHAEIRNIYGQKARQRIVEYFAQEAIFDHLIHAFHKTIKDFRKNPPKQPKSVNFDLLINKKVKRLLKNIKRFSQLFYESL